ncbi:MAG: DUF2255 family protein [Candidatus Dormiibacterota bacterium]
MTAWTGDELSRIGAADELLIESFRDYGTLRKPVTIWVVRHGDDLYVRSVHGRTAAWFRGTQERHEGRIRAGGVGRNVSFADTGHEMDDALDTDYRTKYRRYARSIVDSIVSPQARAATLKLVPRAAGGAGG